MGDAAHGESLDHEVYRAPFAVQPPFESWDTPDNYKSRSLGAEKLPDKMKVWLVQKTGMSFGSVVATVYGFTDSPDAEVLAPGFNTGKEYGAVGVGRHGNFLQWGYSAPPSQMTEAGQKFFLNCVHYIRRFDGKTPLVRHKSSPRVDTLRLGGIMNRIDGDRKEFFCGIFPSELYPKYGSDPDGLVKYYKENLEWVYREKVFKVDEELKALGIASNRKVESLRRLIELLDDAGQADTARRILVRYTDQRFDSSRQWRQWYEDNKDRIFFTDVGGYKFMAAPRGYIAGR